MKIPNNISIALRRRTRFAQKLQEVCAIVDDFLIQNEIDAGDANYLTGCEIYVNPLSAEMACRDAISEKKEQEHE